MKSLLILATFVMASGALAKGGHSGHHHHHAQADETAAPGSSDGTPTSPNSQTSPNTRSSDNASASAISPTLKSTPTSAIAPTSPNAPTQPQPPAAQLTDVTYTFDPAKLAAANDSFHFLRSYVDYYYFLYRANRAQLTALAGLDDQAAWCVGDAHPENFGVILQEDDSSVFAVNDIDDAGPCPAVLDLSRLLVASKLYDRQIDTSDLIKAYRHGLEGEQAKIPSTVKDMFKDSAKKGERPEKSRVDQNQNQSQIQNHTQTNRLVRTPQAKEVTPEIAAQLTTAYKSLFPRRADLVDAIETSKVGGGSGGLRRYELLVQDKHGLVNIELKQEIVPSIYPVATSAIPTFTIRIPHTIAIEQAGQPSSYLSTFVIDGLDMISRPRFAGNIGADLAKNSPKDNRALIEYEAYILGVTHARSLDGAKWSDRLKAIDTALLEADIDALTKAFAAKYAELKGP